VFFALLKVGEKGKEEEVNRRRTEGRKDGRKDGRTKGREEGETGIPSSLLCKIKRSHLQKQCEAVIINVVFLKPFSLCFVKYFTKHSLNTTSKKFSPQNLTEIYKYYLLSHADVSTSAILKMRRKHNNI